MSASGKTKIGYKCIRVNCSQLTSLMARDAGVSVEYKVGKFIKPKITNSCLFVFDTLDDAKNFSYMCGGSVYKCEYEPAHYKVTPLTWISHITKFWNTKKSKKSTENFLGSKSIPKGTVPASRVKLLEKVC